MSTNKKSSNNALAMTLLKGRTFIVLIVLLIFFSIKAANFLSLNTAIRFCCPKVSVQNG